MVAVRMMQVAVDQIVDMIAVWHRFVTASGPVHMARIMTTAPMLRRALVGIGR